MRTSLRFILILIIFAGSAFAAGYIAGWSKGNVFNAAKSDTQRSASPPMDAPATAETPVAQAMPDNPAPEEPGPSVKRQNVSEAKPKEEPPVASSPPRNQAAQPDPPVRKVKTTQPAPSLKDNSTSATPTTVEPSPAENETPKNNVAVGRLEPLIFAEESTRDFGTVQEGDVVEESFSFENRGKGMLLIDSVKTSCGCTAALATSKQLAPGESGRIGVKFRSRGFKGKVKKKVYVESNDPKNPRLTLVLTGKVNRDIDVTPTFVRIGKLAVGATTTQTVCVQSELGTPFRILELSATSPNVHLSEVREAEGGGYEFDVTAGPVDEPGRLSSSIIITTDSERQSRLSMVLYGSIVPANEGAGE